MKNNYYFCDLTPLKALINKSRGYLRTLHVLVCVVCIVEGAWAGEKCSGRSDAVAMRCHGNQRQLLNIPTGAYGWVWVHTDLSQSFDACRSTPSRRMGVDVVTVTVFVFIAAFSIIGHRIIRYVQRYVSNAIK